MFKYDKSVLSHHIHNIIMICKQAQEMGKLYINVVASMVYIYGESYIPKNPIDVSYACFKKLAKLYFKNNDILYRIQ